MNPTKITLFVLLSAAMPSLLGTAAVAPVLDLMKEAFDVPEIIVNLVLTLPPLATAAAGFFIGALSDKIGRVKILAVCLLLFGLAGLSGFFLENIYAIIAFRLILGVSIAGLIPMVSALISEYYDGATRTKYLGYQATSIGIGTLILQTGCGALAAFGWHYSFLIYILGLVILPFVLIFLREPEHKTECAETSSVKSKAPLHTYLLIYLSMFILAVLMYVPAVNLSYYLGTFSQNVSPFWTGLLLGLFGLMSAVSGFIFWGFSKRFNPMEMFGIIFAMESIGILLISLTQNLFLIAIGFSFVGFGVGFGTPNGSLWVSKITQSEVLGKYMGGVTVSIFVGLFSTTFIAPLILLVVGAGNYSEMLMLTAIIGCIFAVLWLLFGRFYTPFRLLKSSN